MTDRFDLYAVLYILCSRYHSGQWSRGYRILSRLVRAGYKPGYTTQHHRFENSEQMRLYRHLARQYHHKL